MTDPAETSIPEMGIVHFTDPETGQEMVINTNNPRFRKNYIAESNKAELETFNIMKECQVDMLNLNTEQSYVRELQKFFLKRLKRKRKR